MTLPFNYVGAMLRCWCSGSSSRAVTPRRCSPAVRRQRGGTRWRQQNPPSPAQNLPCSVVTYPATKPPKHNLSFMSPLCRVCSPRQSYELLSKHSYRNKSSPAPCSQPARHTAKCRPRVVGKDTMENKTITTW